MTIRKTVEVICDQCGGNVGRPKPLPASVAWEEITLTSHGYSSEDLVERGGSVHFCSQKCLRHWLLTAPDTGFLTLSIAGEHPADRALTL